MFLNGSSALFLYGTGILLAFIVAYVLLRFRVPQNTDDHGPPTSGECEVYLLHNGKVTETNFAARRCLDRIVDSSDDETRLKRHLLARFADVGQLLAPPVEGGDQSVVSRDGAWQLVREAAGSDVRIEVYSRHTETPGSRDMHRMSADADELRMLRANIRVAPFLLWRQNEKGEVIWANRSYLDAATEVFSDDRIALWPLPALFPSLKSRPDGATDPLRRVQTACPDKAGSHWFDCHMTEIDGDMLCTAFRADDAVRSESRRREFTQTLTKTFADLAIGLAIFDRSRRLVLFNPALTDLTSLQPDFLSSRPSLVGFLDQLRENRVMPEPRDYHTWRKSISDLELAAADGTYSETWSLPDGQTYRISGRPHPDGAVALLFEDISEEMSLTRRFRAELEQSQSVVEALDDAIALFSPNGELSFTNAAYRALWQSDVNNDGTLSTALEASRQWHGMTAPTPVWGDFRDFAFQGRERSEWGANVVLRDGRNLGCRFVPQKGGATMVVFRILTADLSLSEDLRRAV